MKRFFTLLIAMILALTLNTPANAIQTNPKVERIWNLTACKSKGELDCIESLSVVIKGKKITARQTKILPTKGKTETGTPITGGNSYWTFPGYSSDVMIEARLESPKNVLWVQPNGEKFRASSLRVYLNGWPLRVDHEFTIKVRTSWIIPTDVQLHADDSDWSVKKIDGGRIWTIKGKRSPISFYSNDWVNKLERSAKADMEQVRWGFLVHHAAPNGNGGYFDDRCASEGFSVEAHNAPGAGKPMWDEGSETLYFNISSPPRNSKGKTIQGKFKIWMSTSYVRCMWPKSTLGFAKQLTVQVLSKDGKEQVVDAWSLVDTGEFHVEINNFNYGNTTIKIKPLRISINCKASNSEEIQVVTDVSPVCPQGFEPAF